MTDLRRRGHRARVTFVLVLACCALAGLTLAEASQASHGPTPVGASPTRVSLVPWFEQCLPGSANSLHGPPHTDPSCNPAERETTASPTTAAIMGPASIGFVRYVVCPVGTTSAFCTPTGGVMPLPDIRITGNILDVQCGFVAVGGCAAGVVDYQSDVGADPYTTPGGAGTAPTPACFPTGSPTSCIGGADIEIAPEIPGAVPGLPAGSSSYRTTDDYNCDPAPANPTPGPACPATVGGPDYGATALDWGSAPGTGLPDPPGVPMECIPIGPVTAAPGSSCGVNTTFNALIPGMVIDGKEAVVQIGQVRIRDAGPNNDVIDFTDPRDNMVFAVQGIVAP
jgi:hypothetical protein